MTTLINPRLFQLAAATVTKQAKLQKQAVQPPGDPAMGGAPPGDPSMGGAPPADPSMGGMPPGGATPPAPMPDPSGGAGAPMPGGGGLTPDSIQQMIQQGVQSAMGGQGGMGGGGMGAGGGMAGSNKQNKDQQQMQSQMDLFQIKKYLFLIGQAMGIDPPPALMDGPNRDPNTGVSMAPGQPGSTSDPAVLQQQAAEAQQGGEGGQGAAPKSSIPPIQPIAGAMPPGGGGGGGGGEKTGAVRVGAPYRGGMISTMTGQLVKEGRDIQNQASALAAVLRSRK